MAPGRMLRLRPMRGRSAKCRPGARMQTGVRRCIRRTAWRAPSRTGPTRSFDLVLPAHRAPPRALSQIARPLDRAGGGATLEEGFSTQAAARPDGAGVPHGRSLRLRVAHRILARRALRSRGCGHAIRHGAGRQCRGDRTLDGRRDRLPVAARCARVHARQPGAARARARACRGGCGPAQIACHGRAERVAHDVQLAQHRPALRGDPDRWAGNADGADRGRAGPGCRHPLGSLIAMPLVSIIVPTHDRAQMLKEAVDSALAQTFQDFELIVVLNGASAASVEMANRLAANPKVKVVEMADDTLAASRNFGLEFASGEWIAFLDDDDIWLPHKLATQLDAARRS